MIVADDGSRDGTADRRRGGARVVRLPRLGKGQALTLGEAEAPAGSCSSAMQTWAATLPAGRVGADLAIAVFAEKQGGGFGIAKQAGRALIRALSGFEAREPLSGQQALTAAARRSCFPLAAGFGCEVRMTVDAARAGLEIEERELALHRATGRDPAGFLHRGRQLLDALLACGPLGVNYRGLRLPLVGWTLGVRATARSRRSRRSAWPTTCGQARSAAFALTYRRGEPRECSSWSGSRSSACSRPAS